MDDDYIGSCIRMAMSKNRVSNPKLAAHMGCSLVTVINWRNGKIRDIETLTRVADFCGMTREEMLALVSREEQIAKS